MTVLVSALTPVKVSVAGPWQRHSGRIVAGLLAAAALSWSLSLASMRTEQVNVFGLLFAASPLFVVSIVLATVAFLAAIRWSQHRLAAVALGAGILLLRLPSAVAVSLPLYPWTYKHFGVIDYILTYGRLSQGTDIYHSWPGMFALFAWIQQLTGASEFALALWFTPVYQLALTAAIYVLARSWRLGVGPALVAAFIAHAVNWVAQDYFSPQAVALLLAVAVLTLLSGAGGIGRRYHRHSIWIALVIFTAVVVTHQLTPYWLLLVIAAASVLGFVQPRWAVLIFAAITVGFTAVNFGVISSYGSLISLNPLANAASNLQSLYPSPGQILTSWSGRIVSAATWIATITLLVVQWRRRWDRRYTLLLASVALGSFVLLLGQSYGGEAIFRVFLYSVPGCALVLGVPAHRAILTPMQWDRSVAVALGTAASLLVITVASAQAFYGAWFPNRVDEDALDASVWIVENASSDSVVLALAPGAPGRVVARYTEFVDRHRNFDGGVNAWDGWLGTDFRDRGRVNQLTDGYVYQRQRAFVLITRQMKVYNQYYGLFPDGAIDRFESQLLANSHWRPLIRTDTLTLLELDLGDR